MHCSVFATVLNISVHVCKKCLPSGLVFLLQSQIILSLLRQTRQQWNSGSLRICQQAAEHGEYIKGPGGTLQVRAPVVGFGAEAPLKPFVHFHTKAGLTVKDLTDSQCPRLIAFAVKTTAVPTFVQWEGLPPGYASAVGYNNKNKYSGGS